jgi:hypothetical protein
VPDASNLSNDGFMTLLPDGYEPPDERTFVVIGLARGGTTMVARLLEAFGVHMGDEADNPVVEDRRMAAAIEDGGDAAVRAVVADYDAHHAVWGFKRPNVFRALDAQNLPFRNPHFVVVVRDPLAIANRNRISMFKDPLVDMADSVELMADLVRFVDAQRAHPMFLLSFDKSLMNVRSLVGDMADFAGVELTQPMRRRALKSIEVDNNNYLELSRADSFMGRITDAADGTVTGFFRYHHHDANPPLEVYVDDEPVDATLRWFDTHIDRPNGKRFSGRYGFELQLERVRLEPGNQVSVLVDDERRQELRNSPYRVR